MIITIQIKEVISYKEVIRLKGKEEIRVTMLKILVTIKVVILINMMIFELK